jgi:hypothetical protein
VVASVRLWIRTCAFATGIPASSITVPVTVI